jgi:hypothetical protein
VTGHVANLDFTLAAVLPLDGKVPQTANGILPPVSADAGNWLNRKPVLSLAVNRQQFQATT